MSGQNQAAANKQLIHDLYAGPDKGNPRALLDAMADDIEWSLIGTTRFSRTYRGKGEVVEQFLKPVMADLNGEVEVVPTNLIADGEHVAMQAKGKGRTRFGKQYNNTYCVVFRIVGGKIRQITEYCDTELVSEAFRA